LVARFGIGLIPAQFDLVTLDVRECGGPMAALFAKGNSKTAFALS